MDCFEAAKRNDLVDSPGNSLASAAGSSISSLACCQFRLHRDRQFPWAARSTDPEVLNRSGVAEPEHGSSDRSRGPDLPVSARQSNTYERRELPDDARSPAPGT